MAYVNGANDNFKGLATLYGSQTTNYKTAIVWATLTTLAGSILSILLSKSLLTNFSGKGLIPDSLVTSPHFIIAVSIGAGATLLIATLTGIPISTTHSIIGALIGGGVIAESGSVNFTRLNSVFILPLLLSPVISFSLSKMLYKIFHFVRLKYGIEKTSCLCVEESTIELSPIKINRNLIRSESVSVANIFIDENEKCNDAYVGNILGISFQKVMDKSHFISAGIVSFARGLNDTPKITALLLITQLVSFNYNLIFISLAMALGGILNTKKVAETMSKKITELNPGQGFTANLATSLLVLFASPLGLPISTTHISTAAIFGISSNLTDNNKNTIKYILVSWVFTLPTAAFISALIYKLFLWSY